MSARIEWSSCQVFVFGDEAATFDSIERTADGIVHRAGYASFARNHVLDRRN